MTAHLYFEWSNFFSHIQDKKIGCILVAMHSAYPQTNGKSQILENQYFECEEIHINQVSLSNQCIKSVSSFIAKMTGILLGQKLAIFNKSFSLILISILF